MTAEKNAIKASTIIHALVAGGAKHAVISPGSRSTPLVLACDTHEAIQTHVVLDERSAAFYALGLCRSSQTPVILLCTSGSAGSHYLPAVIEASECRLPLVVLTADRPPELQDCGAPQTINQRHFFAPFVRFFGELSDTDPTVSPTWIGTLTSQAIARSLGTPRGPIHLNVPFRKPLWDPSATPQNLPEVSHVAPSVPAPAPAAIAAANQRIAASKNGIIVCGPMPDGDRTLGPAVSRLAQLLNWPVIADPCSNVKFGAHTIPNILSHGSLLLRSTRFASAVTPDLVLRFGKSPTSKVVNQWLAQSKATTILFDRDGQWHDPLHTAKLLISGSPTLACNRLETSERNDTSWLDMWKRADSATAEAVSNSNTVWEGAVAQTVVDSIPDNGALHVASSMPVRDLDEFSTASSRNLTVYSNRGANGIDGLIATALGQAAGDAKHAVCLLGDLAFLHDIGSLINMASLDIKLTLVVVDNGGGGIFSFLPIAKHKEAFTTYFDTPQGVDIAALCQGAGLQYTVASSLTELSSALAQSDSLPGTKVIRVPVNRTHNIARHNEAWSSVETAVEAVL